MLNTVKNYIRDEKAADGEVSKIIMIVLVIVIIMAIGWFVWNQISERADVANDEIHNSSNPGKGNEFGGNPFGN